MQGHARREEDTVSAVSEDECPSIEKSLLRLGSSLVGRSIEVQREERKRSGEFDQGRHLRVEPIIVPGPHGIAVVQVMRLIPGCRVDSRYVNKLEGKDK